MTLPPDVQADVLEKMARILEPQAWAALGTGDTLAYKNRRTSSQRKAQAALTAALPVIRKAVLEEAARVADEQAAEKEDAAPFEETPDYSERMLVYAKHIRRVARAIRALAGEVR